MAKRVKVKAHTRLIDSFKRKAVLEKENYIKTRDEESLRQAAEKVWGSTVQLIQHISKTRTTSHEHLRQIVEEFDDPELTQLFYFAKHLHTYFYVGEDDKGLILKEIDMCFSLIKKIRAKYKI